MANLMDLVRELKTLNARKKGGEALSATDEARRKELKAYLRDALEQQSGAQSLEDSAIRDAGAHRTGSQKPVPSGSSAPKAAPSGSSAPKPVPSGSSAPKAVPSASSAPKPVPSASSAPKPVPTAGAKPLSMADIMSSSKAPAAGGRPGAVAAPFVDDEVIPAPPKRGAPPVAAPFDDVIPDPPKKQAPAPYVPKKDAFAIDFGKANELIGNAMKSDAVAKVDPLSARQAHASQAEIEDTEALADAAVRANKKRARAQDAEEAVAQLQSTEVAYTPPETNLALEQYYGSYADEGFAVVEATAAGELRPIDPREMELQKLDFGASGSGTVTVTVPPGLAFLDDFAALYAKRILPPPEDEVVVDSTDPNLLIPGKRKVTVHLLNGEKRQGAIRSLRRGELGFKLEPLGSGQTEELSIAQVKAVFIHLQANQQVKDVQGRNLTVTFRDSRSVQGVSDDYQPGAPVFTLVPPAGRGQFERIIVNSAAVKSVG